MLYHSKIESLKIHNNPIRKLLYYSILSLKLAFVEEKLMIFKYFSIPFLFYKITKINVIFDPSTLFYTRTEYSR